MARRCGRTTTSPSTMFSREKPTGSAWWCLLCASVLFGSAAEAGLYSASDLIALLTPENVGSVMVNSSAATVVVFYASWCGHCMAFSPIYKSLARDMKEWKPAVELAAVDCASTEGRIICSAYNIRGYPAIQFFPAYSTASTQGVSFRDSPRDVQALRHKIIDCLETHKEPWPPACPPLEPTSQAEIDSFFENSDQQLALVFEKNDSYIGRELTLDLLQFENIAVRRVLNTEEGLVSKLGVTEFPSCYLYYPGGNFTRLKVNVEARTFYSYALKSLHGVVRSGKSPVVTYGVVSNTTRDPWRPFNRSRVYMADLESTLHYSLRVELATQTAFSGGALISLKKYINVLAKYFPGRPMVMNLLKSLNAWLQNQKGHEISYEAFKAILDNSAQAPATALPEGVRWVACQGSQSHFRRYPCGVWTLFHLLTVQAKNAQASDPLEVLDAMRNYVHNFFGCRPCAEHFENMARESLLEVNTPSLAVLWLWSRHNRVNNRLSGDFSEDPKFPKIQWPPPEMCPACHTLRDNGDHRWDKEQVLPFLLSYFSSDHILTDYLEDETQVLTKQREKHASQLLALEARKKLERAVRAAPDSAMTPRPLEPTVPDEEEEEEEGEEPQDEAMADEEEEGGEGPAAAAGEPNAWVKSEMAVGPSGRRSHRKPSIVGMRMREMQEDIVDLDSFVNQHFKAKALQLAAASRVKRRTLQRKVEPEPGPVFGLGMELDAGLGMVGLQPMDTDFELEVGQKRKRLQKRDLTGQYFGEEPYPRGGWMSMLSVGFSKVDISLCVLLYFLSSMCLLGMYMFFKKHFRLRRFKMPLP